MGCVQQAVLEFDEEVRAPWRPRLVATALLDPSSGGAEWGSSRPMYPSRRGPVTAADRQAPPRAGEPVAARGRRAAGGEDVVAVRIGPAPRPVPDRRRRTRLRLTRRARRCGLLLALVAGVALGCWLAPVVGGSDSGLRLAGVTAVVVQQGDTLWSIASPVAGGHDVRAAVAEIRRLNGLSSARLVPGQTLRLP